MRLIRLYIDQDLDIKKSKSEDQKYYQDDLMIPLDQASLNGKFAGKGYIRYVRLMASN